MKKNHSVVLVFTFLLHISRYKIFLNKLLVGSISKLGNLELRTTERTKKLTGGFMTADFFSYCKHCVLAMRFIVHVYMYLIIVIFKVHNKSQKKFILCYDSLPRSAYNLYIQFIYSNTWVVIHFNCLVISLEVLYMYLNHISGSCDALLLVYSLWCQRKGVANVFFNKLAMLLHFIWL